MRLYSTLTVHRHKNMRERIPSLETLNQNVFEIDVVGQSVEPADNGPLHFLHGQIKVCGEKVQWTFAAPEVISTEAVSAFIPGYGGFKSSSRGPRNAFAQSGQPCISYGPVRNDNESLFNNLTIPQAAHIKTIEAVMADVEETVGGKFDFPNHDQFDFGRQILIPHSMGGAAAFPYATKNVSKIERIDAIATVGFGSPTISQLIETFPKYLSGKMPTELRPLFFHKDPRKTAANFMRINAYYFRRLDRTAGEAWSCLTTDLREDSSQLQENGVSINYTSLEHDGLIPPNEGIARYVGRYGLMLNVGHLAPQKYPHETVAAVTILNSKGGQDPESASQDAISSIAA
jgi:hypothetical protein